MIRINASSAYIAKNCQGSLEFESKRYPLEKQSKDAKAGDDAHKVLTDELMKGQIPKTLLPYVPPAFDELLVEEEMLVEDKKLGFSFYARPDLRVVSKDSLYVLDFKTGFSDVAEMDPLQNILGAYLHLKTEKKAKDIKRVVCRFIGTETGVTTYEVFSVLEIETVIKDLVTKLSKGLKAKTPSLNTGTHCRYCSHRTHCPKLKKAIQEFTNPKLRGVDVEELPRDLVRLLPVADKIIDDFRKKLKERLEDGVVSDIHGVSLKFQNSPRSWDLSIDIETLASITKKPKTAFQDFKLKTVKAVLDEFPELENKLSTYIVQGKQARLVISED